MRPKFSYICLEQSRSTLLFQIYILCVTDMEKQNNIRMHLLYGIVLCAVLGMAGKLISGYLPLGSVAIAILIGMIIGNVVKPGKKFATGITFSEKKILSLAIALMGVNLDYAILKDLGYGSIVLIIAAMGVTIGSAVLLGRVFKWKPSLALLLGIGNGVCGSSAIAATEHIIGADKEDVGLAVAVVNFLGTVGMLFLPLLGTMMLHLTDLRAGILVGNTLQAVGQVTAGGFAISDLAGQTATVVKMGRILMLTPLIFILIGVFSQKTSPAQQSVKKAPKVPLFILGFILFSLVATFHILPENVLKALSTISHTALLVAMAGIGLKITFGSILREGQSALTIGSLVFLIQIVFSGSIIWLLF